MVSGVLCKPMASVDLGYCTNDQLMHVSFALNHKVGMVTLDRVIAYATTYVLRCLGWSYSS